MSKAIVGSADVTRITYRNASGVATEPDAVVAFAKRPDDTVSAAGITITNVSTGVRDIEVTLGDIGLWYLEVTGTGASIVDDVFEKMICVVASSVA